jgi:virginiamycin B lyase
MPSFCWTNSVANTMGRANLDGTGVDQGFFGASNAQGVAVDGAHIYWTIFKGPIGRANLDGTDVNPNFAGGTVGNPVSNPQGVAVDGGHVCWRNSIAGVPCCLVTTIGRANLDGTGVDPNFIVVMGAAALGVAVDDAHVYWTGSNVIGRANLDGTGVNQSFITGASVPCGVAVDGAHIYRVNTAPGTIGRANLDGTGVDQSFITGATDPTAVAVDALSARHPRRLPSPGCSRRSSGSGSRTGPSAASRPSSAPRSDGSTPATANPPAPVFREGRDLVAWEGELRAWAERHRNGGPT